MSAKLIWLSETVNEATDLGGKAASLKSLFRRGLPVPNAFVIRANVKEMTSELEKELLSAFDRLGAREVAVRSSALSEDGSEDSWAGQFDTFLHVQRQDLIDSVKKCWSSLDNERSHAYASARGQSTDADIAVVVQAMVQSEISGVMFSRDPRGDNPDVIVIEATHGVGEKLVQGEVNPDEYTVKRDSFEIISRSLQGDEPALTDEQIVELANHVMRIEALFGAPQDIEWAIAEGKIFILQARPITTLQHITIDSVIPVWRDQLLFRWGPVPGELYYMNDYVDACVAVIKRDGIDYFPEMLVVFSAGEVLWVCEQAKMVEMGKWWFQKLLSDPEQVTQQRGAYNEALKAKHQFEAKLDQADLTNLSKDKLVGLLREYYEVLQSFWRPTIPTELANYGSIEVLNELLKADISDDKARAEVSNSLLLPPGFTYSQIEEFELAEATDMAAHASKWQWLANSYAGPEQLDVGSFAKRKAELSADVKTKAAADLEQQKRQQDELVRRNNVSEEAVSAARMIAEAMMWQDGRKAELLISVMWKGRLLERAAAFLKQTTAELVHLPVNGVIAALQDESVESYAGYRFKGVDIAQLTPAQNSLGWELYAYHTLRQNMDGVQGVVASRGPQLVTHGHAVIVLDPQEEMDFPDGSILVAQMTTPDYIFLMRKASAIVTDTGGITSHAAIVSRELNVPCIVGTKNATKVFDNGDLLQVNTLHGTALRMKMAERGS